MKQEDDFIDELFDGLDIPDKKDNDDDGEIITTELDSRLVGTGTNVEIATRVGIGDVDGNLFKEINNIDAKQQSELKSHMKGITKSAAEIMERNLPDVESFHADEMEDRAGIFDILNKAGGDADSFEEGFETAVNEDLLLGKLPSIAKRVKIKETDEQLGVIEIDGEEVGRRLADTDKKMAEWLLKHTLRFFSPLTIEKELLVEKRKNELKKLFLSERTYALYRHKFIHEKYANVLQSLPKVIREEHGDAFLREAFMILHVLFKFGKGTETLDELTLAEIICEQNDMLPIAIMPEYEGKEFTVDFFLDLAKEGVFKKIQRMVNDDILSNQLTNMTSYVSQLIDDMVKGAVTNETTRQLKDLTDMLGKIQSMSNTLSTNGKTNNLAYVFNDTTNDIDYSKLVDIEYIDPEKTIPFDFYYYIACYNKDQDGNMIFVGWLTHDKARNKYIASENDINVWKVVNGDKDMERKILTILENERKHGDYSEYRVLKMYNKQHRLVTKV